jgi:hypothetical protein
MCLWFNLLSNSLWLSKMTLLYLSYNSCCNSLLARITKEFNGPDVWFLVATSLAIRKISVTTQLATQLHESRCKSNSLEFYWAISYFSVYWEITKPLKIILPPATNTCIYIVLSRYILVFRYIYIKTCISYRREYMYFKICRSNTLSSISWTISARRPRINGLDYMF